MELAPSNAPSPGGPSCSPWFAEMEASLSLAFAVLPWPEGEKAALWARLQGGERPLVPDLETLAQEVPRWRQEAQARGARLVLAGDPGAEEWMSALPYPVALWVRGTLPPAGPRLALVGSRTPTFLGRTRARTWAKALTENGVAVVSGLARGIDGAAHEGALEAGPTWGVMGSGLDHPYPREHRGLMDRMVAAGGGVITPFPPEAAPQKWHFPRRNVLLAAWTHGVVVLEAKLRSGSLVTARLALDMGKELWVVPGAPEEPMAEGPNKLLREGCCRAALGPGDLLEDLGLAKGA